MKIETEIEKMETNMIAGDYSSSHNKCSLRLQCSAPKKKNFKIKSGSCNFK